MTDTNNQPAIQSSPSGDTGFPPPPSTNTPITPQPTPTPDSPPAPTPTPSPVTPPVETPTAPTPAPETPPSPPTESPTMPTPTSETPASSPSPTTPTPASVPAASPTADTAIQGKGAGKYQVKVIAEKCIGAASCVAVAPKAFQLNDQQIAQVLPTISQESDENLLLAAQSCPTMAIEVVDTETGQTVWPK